MIYEPPFDSDSGEKESSTPTMATSMQLGATASQPGAADESSEESSDDDSASAENKGKYVPCQLSSPFYGSLC